MKIVENVKAGLILGGPSINVFMISNIPGGIIYHRLILLIRPRKGSVFGVSLRIEKIRSKGIYNRIMNTDEIRYIF